MSKARLAARGQQFVHLIQDREEEEIIFDTDNFENGWCGDENPRKMDITSWSYATGICYLSGRCIVSNGVTELLSNVTPPDSNKILNVIAYQDPVEGVMLLRVTKNKIYKITSTGYVQITPSAIAGNVGGDNDFFSFASADNRFFFSNNAVDPIREIDAVALTYKALGNAPRYKYIISAFNRLIGANLRDSVGGDNPIQLGWSGDQSYGEWDPLVDGTAGSTPLVTSPADTSDFITGLVALENYIVIFRQKSIWLGQFQASGSNPFYFYPIPQAVGCDCPRTIQKQEDGKLIWYNSITGGVYQLGIPSGGLVDLTDIEPRKTKWSIRNIIKNQGHFSTDAIFGTYNENTKTYTLTSYPTAAAAAYSFQYSFIYKNWVMPHNLRATCSYVPDLPSSSITIDELTGTIDDLAGEIDELGGIPSVISTFYGTAAGSIFLQAPFTGDLQYESPSTSSPNEWEVMTKIFTLPSEYTNWSEIAFNYTAYLGDSFADQFRLQVLPRILVVGGEIASKIVTVTVDDYSAIVRIRKPIRARELVIKISSSSLMLAFNRLTIKGYRGAESKSASNPGRL